MKLTGRKKRRQDMPQDTAYKETAVTQESIYRRFLPTELLGMTGTHDTSTQPKGMAAVILNGNITGFQELIHDTPMKEVYRLINQVMSFCVPMIERKNGIIHCFQDAGVSALFREQMEDGLDAASGICEEIIQLADCKHYQNFAIGLCYGFVMVGIVGYGERLSVLTLSSYTGLGEFLCKSAPRYYARILAVESYVSKIRDFGKRYNCRLLGTFYIRDRQCMEKVYDIYDGDQVAVRNKKRKTKMLFEQGVRLFLDRRFGEARTCFIEVLKADRDDRAAREYIFLCDKYGSMSKEEKLSVDIFLAAY